MDSPPRPQAARRAPVGSRPASPPGAIARDAADQATLPRARPSAPALPAPFLAVRRVVHPGRRPRRGHPVLPRSSAAGGAGAQPDARGRGRDAGMVHADPASRDRARDRERVPPAAPPPAPAALRQDVAALPAALRPEAVQQALRPPSRGVLRTEPPRRGLRRDVRRLADAQLELAATLHRMARAPEARVRRRSDARSLRGAAGRGRATGGRSAAHAAQDAARALPREALALRARQPARVRRRAATRVLDPEGVRRVPDGVELPAQLPAAAPPT